MRILMLRNWGSFCRGRVYTLDNATGRRLVRMKYAIPGAQMTEVPEANKAMKSEQVIRA